MSSVNANYRYAYSRVFPSEGRRSHGQEEYYVKIHIWYTDAYSGKCGHASISLHAPDGTKIYAGLWPRESSSHFSFLYNNPLCHLFVGVPGQILKGRKLCEQRESDADDEQLKPNVVYKIKLDAGQHSELKGKMEKVSKAVEESKIFYALFDTNLFTMVRGLAHGAAVKELLDPDFLEAFPDVLETARDLRENKNTTMHCTTLVADILESSGLFKFERSPTPWKLSPSGLSSEIERHQKIHPELISKHFHSVKTSAERKPSETPYD